VIPSNFGVDYAKAFEELAIQPHIQEQLVEWIERGIEPSLFLRQVLTNNLAVVFISPDRAEQAGVRGIVRFLVNYAPRDCWGAGNTDGWSYWRSRESALAQTPASE